MNAQASATREAKFLAVFSQRMAIRLKRLTLPTACSIQGCLVLWTLKADLGFPKRKMSESMRGNPNRRLPHARVATGDFAVDPRPSSRRRQAVRSGHGAALRHSRHGRRSQFVSANA